MTRPYSFHLSGGRRERRRTTACSRLTAVVAKRWHNSTDDATRVARFIARQGGHAVGIGDGKLFDGNAVGEASSFPVVHAIARTPPY